MFGSFPADRPNATQGSIFYHLLPYLEQANLHNLGPDVARSHRLEVYQAPNDTSYGNGTYVLETQIPGWADPTNNVWGLSSYSANWQVFGDYGKKFGGIRDGLSNTILFNEKFAVSSRDTGDPQQGANLWGYGVLPPSMPCDYTQDLPADHLYVSAYWARSGFVNRGGPVPTSWAGDEPWRCRCLLRPEFGVTPTSAHPLKSQALSSGIINMAMADGSVRSASSSVSDPAWSAGETPDNGEVLRPDE